jgi:hypothetical protein
VAKPVISHIVLPDDAGNTGKKVLTQTRDYGGGIVRHEHFYVQARESELLGVYRAALAQQTVQASAQNGTSTGFLWAHVPTAVTNKWARLRRVYITSHHSTALATPTAPRILLSRMTFTGTASGAAHVADKIQSDFPTPVLDLRTAVTGLTPSLVASMGVAAITGAITAVGAYGVNDVDIISPVDAEDNWPVIKPGEGVVLWQDVAGTASDTRKFNPVLVWDEIDVA